MTVNDGHKCIGVFHCLLAHVLYSALLVVQYRQ